MNTEFLIPVGLFLTTASGDSWPVILIQAIGALLIAIPAYKFNKGRTQ